ncbi:MAG: IS66 family transposase [Lachnospiraceae bacterium]|nr:IS66 family transposase [Lachnospiraceae bacterium]
MAPEEIKYIQDDLNKTRDELLAVIVSLRQEKELQLTYRAENERAMKSMTLEYAQLLQENERLQKENQHLSQLLTLTQDKEQLKTKAIFGRGTEKLDDLLENGKIIELIDEATTEDSGSYGQSSSRTTAGMHAPKKKGKKRQAKKVDLDALPQRSCFLCDIKKFDELYGKGGWRIAHWRSRRTVEVVRGYYVLTTYTPVLSIGLHHALVTIPNDCLLPKSFASASLAADIIYQKFALRVSTYRMEQEYQDFGLPLSRQLMSDWIIRFAEMYFALIYDRLKELMLEVPYHQCDETTWRVLNDGRKAGSKSFIWCHITSELYDCDPIVLFAYEATRGTDHLRQFYEDFKGFISCDAYCSYHVLGRESLGIILICGCAMHMRRRFVDSLALKDTGAMSEEAREALPEMIALRMIGKIYEADEALKDLDCTQRLLKRQTDVRPLVEEYFEYIETIDCTSPEVSARLKDAVTYSRNQKEYLMRFLEDGNVPIDNGACERHIRPVAASRHSFLFSDSIRGAEALAIMYTIVETARANHANVYWYLRYVLEEMPKHMDDKDLRFLDGMFPWSPKYRAYEEKMARETGSEQGMPGTRPELPKTPRKRDERHAQTA